MPSLEARQAALATSMDEHDKDEPVPEPHPAFALFAEPKPSAVLSKVLNKTQEDHKPDLKPSLKSSPFIPTPLNKPGFKDDKGFNLDEKTPFVEATEDTYAGESLLRFTRDKGQENHDIQSFPTVKMKPNNEVKHNSKLEPPSEPKMDNEEVDFKIEPCAGPVLEDEDVKPKPPELVSEGPKTTRSGRTHNVTSWIPSKAKKAFGLAMVGLTLCQHMSLQCQAKGCSHFPFLFKPMLHQFQSP